MSIGFTEIYTAGSGLAVGSLEPLTGRDNKKWLASFQVVKTIGDMAFFSAQGETMYVMFSLIGNLAGMFAAFYFATRQTSKDNNNDLTN